MNRSLEALAIFAICLAGILAVVRFSTQDGATGPGSVANRGKSPAVPATGSSSAADQREASQPDDLSPVEPATNVLAHEQGCGLDRNEGKVYPPQSPLLSPREVAQRAIRSAPWRMVVLPEAESEELATGYDEEYDAAMADALFSTTEGIDLSQGDLDRQQIEADYAAAELAAAGEATGSNPQSTAFVQGLLALRDSSLARLQQWKTTYADPSVRAIENKWSVSRWPLLLQYPRAKQEARQLLLHRQRAESRRMPISWDDYLSFAERHLTHPAESIQTAQERKVPKSKLFPR
jgi:hypothetical protein